MRTDCHPDEPRPSGSPRRMPRACASVCPLLYSRSSLGRSLPITVRDGACNLSGPQWVRIGAPGELTIALSAISGSAPPESVCTREAELSRRRWITWI